MTEAVIASSEKNVSRLDEPMGEVREVMTPRAPLMQEEGIGRFRRWIEWTRTGP